MHTHERLSIDINMFLFFILVHVFRLLVCSLYIHTLEIVIVRSTQIDRSIDS